MRLKVGNCPDSWGVWFGEPDPLQTPWERCYDEIKEAGYKYVESGPWGYAPTDAQVMKAAMEARGFSVTGTNMMVHYEDVEARDQIRSVARQISDYLAKLDAEYFIFIDGSYTGGIHTDPTGREVDMPERLDDAAFDALIEFTVDLARMISADYGLRSVFHPHADTHVQYEDQIERYLEATDHADVGLLLDTGHHAYAGGDPVAFMRKWGHRVDYLHLKNVEPTIAAKVQAENIPMTEATKMGVWVEPGDGVVDFDDFLNAIVEADFSGYAVVEQDMYPVPFDKPLPIAKRTLAWLEEHGYTSA